MKTLVWALAFLLLSSLAGFAGDDTASYPNVPKIVSISVHHVKPGKENDYGALVRQVRQTLTSAKADVTWVSATPVTGQGGAISLVSFHPNYADIERSNQEFFKAAGGLMRSAEFNRGVSDAFKGELGIIAKLQTDISYNLAKFDLANATLWEVTTIRVKPDAADAFRDVLKEVVELHKRGNIDENWAIYAVKYGEPGGTFYEVRPLRSMADLDTDLSASHKAVFTESVTRRLEATMRDGIKYEETQILRVSPEWSRPPQTLVAANPDFWTVKEEPTAVATKTRKGKSAVEPAAMKQ